MLTSERYGGVNLGEMSSIHVRQLMQLEINLPTGSVYCVPFGEDGPPVLALPLAHLMTEKSLNVGNCLTTAEIIFGLI